MSLARVEEAIAQQKLALSDLYAQKNSFSFICRLPTEILTDIFICCARDYYCSTSFYHSSISPGWIGISRVCRHWRNVTLKCPILWSYIPIVQPRWVEELLARSKDAPLKIRIMVPPSWGTLQAVMNNVERIQELELQLGTQHTIEAVLSKLSLPAPLLQNLRIQVIGSLSDVSVIPLLFDGDTPVLRTLELSEFPAPLNLLKPTSLTTLVIRRVPFRFLRNIEEFLAMLSCMKDISHLEVEGLLLGSQSFITSAAFDTFQKIDLPRLSRLLIECPLSTAIAFVACVNIPTNTQVRLGCISKGDAPLDNYALLSSVLAQRFYAFAGPTRSDTTIRSLAIESWHPMLTFSTLERDHKSYISEPHIAFPNAIYTSWEQNILLQICLCGLDSDADWEHIISNVCCTLPLTHVQSLHVVRPPPSLSFWERVLAYIQGLRYLRLSQGDLPELASLLSLPPHDTMENLVGHAGARSNPVLAPALEELVLYDITFGAPLSSWGEPDDVDNDLATLAAALSTRKNPGVRLDTFYCHEYDISDSESDEVYTDEESS